MLFLSRRNSHGEPRGPHLGYGGAGEAECVLEQPLLTVPYIPYPPPMYPIQYYPVETDPGDPPNNLLLPFVPISGTFFKYSHKKHIILPL